MKRRIKAFINCLPFTVQFPVCEGKLLLLAYAYEDAIFDWNHDKKEALLRQIELKKPFIQKEK